MGIKYTRNMFKKALLLLTIFCCVLGQNNAEDRSTGLIPEQEDPLLLFSTLSGSFVGIGQRSGEIKWRQDNEPAVKVPLDIAHTTSPMFLPDPKDGSLYLFGTEIDTLKKLPFTIPQLVASSPCRSSDGILYTGRKIDTWFSIDPLTGEREQLLGFETAESTCPLDIKNAVFIGRTEYNIIMVDSLKKERKWNITFYDYSAAKIDEKIDDYDCVHFTSSSTGHIVTLDRRLALILWELDLGSPIIAVYRISKDGLITVPFTSVDVDTLDNVSKLFEFKANHVQLFPTLYIGQHVHGLYAIPSLVDSSTATISSNTEHLMLEGPIIIPPIGNNNNDDDNHATTVDNENTDNNNNNGDKKNNNKPEKKNFIVLGHYKVPAEYKPQNQPLLITGRSDPIIQSTNDGNKINKTDKININFQLINNNNNDDDNNTTKKNNNNYQQKLKIIVSNSYLNAKRWLNQEENTMLKFLLTICVGLIIIISWIAVNYRKSSYNNSKTLYLSRDNSRTSSNGSSRSYINFPEEISEGTVKIGKIIFNMDKILGKGCEGTFVYKGEFDGRLVAVKRILPSCFDFADREVALLRESDAHANVVRYYCTEDDRMFRYIALELAEATLNDYVIGNYNRLTISVKNILLQATLGLEHLHSLDIVHRDIKPHNVLLSMPGPRGEVRAMISDFGLCKKLQSGRISFSRRSGITGTDGWIAPEMLNQERTTCAVDIFSLGCVFYYVLSNGQHPFGDSLKRQANILNENSNLSSLNNICDYDKELALILIKSMIDGDPANRPSASAVEKFPLFWNTSRILNFFQDVSDRVEKDEPDSPALMSLETCSLKIVKNDWRVCIDHEVANDLRKYRSYRGESVRDLLRALRNKKHHYRELTPEAQASLGTIPGEFTNYWLSRFPCLLSHSWCVMQKFRKEAALQDYYHNEYEFKTYFAHEHVVNLTISGTNNYNMMVNGEQSPRHFTNNKTTNWRFREPVDWSPNRSRFRGNRKKQQQDRRKPEGQIVWTLPPAS